MLREILFSRLDGISINTLTFRILKFSFICGLLAFPRVSDEIVRCLSLHGLSQGTFVTLLTCTVTFFFIEFHSDKNVRVLKKSREA